MGGSRHIGFRASLTADLAPATSLVGKGRFLNVIFYHIELRNFDSIRRYRNEASTSGVYYPLPMAASLYFVMLNEVKHLAQCQGDGHYKPHGVGWLSCLSQWKGNAKARYGGISKEVSPTSFFMSILGQNP